MNKQHKILAEQLNTTTISYTKWLFSIQARRASRKLKRFFLNKLFRTYRLETLDTCLEKHEGFVLNAVNFSVTRASLEFSRSARESSSNKYTAEKRNFNNG